MRKYVQTMDGPLFVAGKSKQCTNPECSHADHHYHASGVLKISLPHSTYGLDVLAFIGWQHENEHQQFVEIREKLDQRGVEVSERHVGRLYRQFLALLGGTNERVKRELEETAKEHGGLIWAIDALQPEGHGTQLYVLYEVLSGTPVDAIQTSYPTVDELVEWLEPYRELPYEVLATLSDGEDRIIAALKASWPSAPHQRCQEHILGNLAEPVLKEDAKLRKWMRNDLSGLPRVPTEVADEEVEREAGVEDMESPTFLPDRRGGRDEELMGLEAQVRVAIRDAVNRESRKPFHWGGLVGYDQLSHIAEALNDVPTEAGTVYLGQLAERVNGLVERYRVNAQDLREAHTWLRRIAECLRYPPSSHPESHATDNGLSSEQVEQEMKELLAEFQPDLKRRPAQAALYGTWHRIWADSGSAWLHCYDIPGLPPDNLAMESLFGQLRCHQRRISGRKSTRKLRDFGQYQVLFLADSEDELLEQIRQVPLEEYEENRRRLAEAETPRRFLHRLHRDPLDTMRQLLEQHAARRAELAFSRDPPRGDG
jgi:hypothetical protein